MSARPVKCAAGDTHECNAVQVHGMTGNHLSGGPVPVVLVALGILRGFCMGFMRIHEFSDDLSLATGRVD